MAAINPIATSMRMSLNLGLVDGKNVVKTVSVSKIDTEITAEKLAACVAAFVPLFEHSVLETKTYETSRLED